MTLLKHDLRKLKNDSNADIDSQWSNLNYAISCNMEGLTDLQYYKKIVEKAYIYGRGSQREADAVTCCSWVVTLPKEISDYGTISKERPLRINPEKETAFFQGVYDFIQNRYATCFHAVIHYDEAGQPHGHFFLVPRVAIDHELIRNKTQKTHIAEKLPSGRWQYKVKLCKDSQGNVIPLSNYAKASDSYEWKISAADVFCKAELQNWHKDLSDYLRRLQIPGADYVCNGKTAGKNISVKSMKELKTLTGLSIEELKELQLNRDQLQKIISTKDRNLIQLLRQMQQKENELTELHRQMEMKDRIIYEKDSRIQSLVKGSLSHEEQLMHMKERIMHTTEQNEQLRTRCEQYQKELEKMREYAENRNLSQIEITEDAKSSWRQNKAWGKELDWGNQERNYEFEKERS